MDIFTQDLEDLPEFCQEVAQEEPQEQKDPQKTKNNDQGNRFAKPKQVNFIKPQIKKKGIAEKAFFREWEGEFDLWNDIPSSWLMTSWIG